MKSQESQGTANGGMSNVTTPSPPELIQESIPHPDPTANPEIAVDSARQGEEVVGELRHRHTAEASQNPNETSAGPPRPNVPPPTFRPVPVFMQQDQLNRGNQNGTSNIIMILFVSIMIAALIARRIYMANEWRFHEGAGEE